MSPTDDRPLCGNCRYWVKADEFSGWPPAGECRLHPPEPVTCHFPRTKPEDWCGDHAPVAKPMPLSSKDEDS